MVVIGGNGINKFFASTKFFLAVVKKKKKRLMVKNMEKITYLKFVMRMTTKRRKSIEIERQATMFRPKSKKGNITKL